MPNKPASKHQRFDETLLLDAAFHNEAADRCAMLHHFDKSVSFLSGPTIVFLDQHANNRELCFVTDGSTGGKKADPAARGAARAFVLASQSVLGNTCPSGKKGPQFGMPEQATSECNAMTQNLQYFVIYYSCGLAGTLKMNLGLVLLTGDGKACESRFIQDWARVQNCDPDGDMDIVRAICRDIEERIKRGDAEDIIRVMEESFSNTIQVSDRMECRWEDPVKAIDELASTYLAG